MKLVVRAVAAALIMLGLTAGGAAAASASAPSSWSQDILPDVDCKEAPKPASPWGNPLALKPAHTSTADPFTPGSKVTINEVYGTGYSVITYDNGCKPGSGMLPAVGAGILNTVGLEWPATLSSIARYMQGLLVEPDSWIGALDAPVREATDAVTEGFWRPWVTIALLLVGALVLSRSLSGRIAGGLTAAVWAVLVLTVSAWLIDYPTEATALVDDGVQTATVSIANGFSGADSTDNAAQAMDRQWDEIDRATVYRTWLEGTFGSSTSKTATTYGPDIFKATHFTWSEWDTYQADPDDKGSKIVEAKAEAFSAAAEKVKEADPIAYDYLTGNKYMKRLSLGPLSYMVWLASALFLLVSSVGLLLAYMVVRVLVPLGPAAGVIFLLEPLRAAALGKLQKVAAILVMGPAYLLAALLVLRFNSAILGAEGIARPLQILMVAVVSFIAWWLIRPAAVAGMGSKFGRMFRQAAAVRMGTRGLRKDLDRDRDRSDDHEEPEGTRTDRSSKPYRRSYPVAEPAPLAITAAAAPRDGDAAVPHYDVVSTSRGTFTDRPPAEPVHVSHRQARSLPAPLSSTFDHGVDQGADADRGRASTTPATFTAAAMVDHSEPPTHSSSGLPSSESARATVEDVRDLPTPVKDGRLMGVDEPLPNSIHDANLTFTDRGEQVFELYRPSTEISRSSNVVSE